MSLLNTSFNESEFRLVSIKGDPQKAGFVLTRRLEKCDPVYADSKIVGLNAKRLYTSPKADRQTYSGTFVSTKLSPDVDEQDAVIIEQTLTKVRDSVADSAWALVKMEGDPAVSGSVMTRGTYYVNPRTADGVYRTLNKDTSFASPKADNQAYAGKFVLSKVVSQKESDETVTILEMCTKVKPIGSADSLTNPLIEREEAAYNPFGINRGADSRVIYRYNNLDPAKDTLCMALKDTTLEVKVTPANSPRWDLVDRKTETKDDNTMSFYLLFRQARWFNTTPVYDTDAGTNIGGYGRTKSLIGSGIPVASAPTILAAVTTESCISKNFREKENGEGNIELSYRNGIRKVTITRRTHSQGNSFASTTKSWLGVKPSLVETTFNGVGGSGGAIRFVGVAGTDTGFVNKSAEMSIFEDGYANIHATAGKNENNWVGDGSDYHYTLYRSSIEKAYKKPVQASPALSDTPADGYYWRVDSETIECKISATATAAKNYADDGLPGSFCKPYKNNLWYAEKVTVRIFSAWKDITGPGAGSV